VATFFEHQAQARKNTRVLVVLYALAVIAVIIAVDLVLGATWIMSMGDTYLPRGKTPTLTALLRLVPTSVYVWGAIITGVIILAASVYKVFKLGGGGRVVAEMVGARRVSPNTQDLLERRLLNVVEEMAIASGVRVPAVYVMDEERGINAFAAGYDISSSVVAVTRGTLERLNRDELQGVIGHEFSHILNGDMRLNIRMLGVLAGIVFIGSIGEFLMRSQRSSGSGRSSGGGGIFLVGLGLFLIGMVGLFFARLIKAAVSRQREFLADASSVQFTRNPDGIAGALDQIAAGPQGALVANRYAEDLSHMFFGQSVKMWFGGLLDTHPPVEERIKRVHPGFRPGNYRKLRASAAEGAEAEADQTEAKRRQAAVGVLTAGAMLPDGRRGADLSAQWGRSASDSARLVGTLDGGKVDYAARLLKALPEALRDRLRDKNGARAALVALLLAHKDDVMQPQLEALKGAGLEALGAAALALVQHTRPLGAGFVLPVIDLALPAAKECDALERAELLKALDVVIQADRRVTLLEFVVLTLVRNQLEPIGKPGAMGRKKLAELKDAVSLVLALVAHAGVRQDATGKRGDVLQAALAAGAREMGIEITPPTGTLTLERAGGALEALKDLAPLQKALLVRGLFASVSTDGTIRVMEAGLVRMVCAVLDCPLPPLLESIDPATLAA
jgi:Zn-dependent protease with chaperone function